MSTYRYVPLYYFYFYWFLYNYAAHAADIENFKFISYRESANSLSELMMMTHFMNAYECHCAQMCHIESIVDTDYCDRRDD